MDNLFFAVTVTEIDREPLANPSLHILRSDSISYIGATVTDEGVTLIGYRRYENDEIEIYTVDETVRYLAHLLGARGKALL